VWGRRVDRYAVGTRVGGVAWSAGGLDRAAERVAEVVLDDERARRAASRSGRVDLHFGEAGQAELLDVDRQLGRVAGALVQPAGFEEDELELTALDARAAVVDELHPSLERAGNGRAEREEVLARAGLECPELVGDPVDHHRGAGVGGGLVDRLLREI